MASPLDKFKILIADCDQHLATVSRLMLFGMGFTNITITPSGAKALAMIKSGDFDFLITDWYLKDMDGISLINHIRRDADSPNPTLPVIMVTARMEQSDVETARDNGIHEYVIKPFSAQAIYNRLEHIVEFPRYFVVGKTFVGPDRRHRQTKAPKDERRKKPVLPQRKPRSTAIAIHSDTAAQVWLPDFAMKHKLGKDVSLRSIITPAVLAQAQAAINSVSNDSLKWIKDDLAELASLCRALSDGKHSAAVVDEITEMALMIGSRGGMFGYNRAAEVAYMLYLFCRKKLQPENPNHFIVLEKHIEVMQIIFGKNIRDEDDDIIAIIRELKRLTDKYAP